jgi:putative membrane protein
MKLIFSILINGLAVYFSAVVLNVLFPSYNPVVVSSYAVAIFVSIVIGVVNGIIAPVLRLVTLPINVLTLGIFGIILNGICMLFVPMIVEFFVPGGFVIGGLLWAIVYSAVLSFVQSTLAVLIK